MSRQLLGSKKVAKLREQTGLDILKVMVRGGTRHRKDLCLADGTITRLYQNGDLDKSEDRWGIEQWRRIQLGETTTDE